MKNKEEKTQLKEIDKDSIINLEYNSMTSKVKFKKIKKYKFIIYFLLFSSICIFLTFIIIFFSLGTLLKSPIKFKNGNNQNNNNEINNNLFYTEPSDNYNIEIEINSNNNSKENLTKIILKNENYVKFEDRYPMWYLTKEVVNKFNKFTNSCYNNILIDKKKYLLLKNPKISAIIPLYNAANYIFYSLRSIQNQKMKEIEIILVDDCSTDDTIKIVEKYMEEDERIRLIKNQKNRKILYSKSMAALNARGKYIIQLDQDDLFIRDDIFDILYYQAEKHNLDLVQISDISKHNFIFENKTRINYANRHMIPPKKTNYKTQPELKDKMFKVGNNYLLWGMLIKSDIYKKAIYHMWPIIINYKMTFQEDYTITFMIVILSKNYRYLSLISLIHLFHEESTSKAYYYNKNFYLAVLFLQYNLYDYYIKDNPQDLKIMIHYIGFFRPVISIGKEYFHKFYNYIMYKVKDNEYLSDKYQKYLKNVLYVKNLQEFKIWNTYNYLENNTEYKIIYDYQYDIVDIKENKENVELKNDEIKVSIVVFCSEYNFLEKTINSIENQKFKDYEIILVYDNNEKINLDRINNYIKNFKNIRLINNENNEVRGYIYSISKGVLSSKGKYILVLESSYTFAKKTSLDEIYTEIIKENNDILEFNLLINSRPNITNTSLSLYKCPHMKSDIKLQEIKYNIKYKEIDHQKDLLANKLIKTDLFKNAINKYKFNDIQRKVFNYYDDIFLFSFKNMNYSFKHIDTLGMIQNINNLNSLNINNITKDKNRKIKDTIFYINFLFENSLNTLEEKEFVIKEYFNVMNIIYNKFTKISNESYNLYEKFLKCDFINEVDKNDLKFYYDYLLT